MNRKEIEERIRKNAVNLDFCAQILEQKKRMNKEGKDFYTCSVGNYQLIIIRTLNDKFEHTLIPTLDFIKEVTMKDTGDYF